MLSFRFDATTGATIWATIALVIFLGVAVYLGLPKMITKMLDERIKAIENELAEAERLRLEAKFLLEEYESKRQAAASEAESIVAAAREEAFRLTAEAKTSLETLIARRTKAVEDKIAQAESQAVAEVRARSADVAVEAARVLLTRQMDKQGRRPGRPGDQGRRRQAELIATRRNDYFKAGPVPAFSFASAKQLRPEQAGALAVHVIVASQRRIGEVALLALGGDDIDGNDQQQRRQRRQAPGADRP